MQKSHTNGKKDTAFTRDRSHELFSDDFCKLACLILADRTKSRSVRILIICRNYVKLISFVISIKILLMTLQLKIREMDIICDFNETRGNQN